MIKGCRRNVVWVKGTGSEMFDEAFFILSDKCDKSKVTKATETDMIKAAHSLIAEGASPAVKRTEAAATHAEKRSARELIWFLLGAVVMAALNALLYLIL